MREPSLVEILLARQREAEMERLTSRPKAEGKRLCKGVGCKRFLAPQQKSDWCHSCKSRYFRHRWRAAKKDRSRERKREKVGKATAGVAWEGV